MTKQILRNAQLHVLVPYKFSNSSSNNYQLLISLTSSVWGCQTMCAWNGLNGWVPLTIYHVVYYLVVKSILHTVERSYRVGSFYFSSDKWPLSTVMDIESNQLRKTTSIAVDGQRWFVCTANSP